jgi:hypothetical protein
MIIAKFDTSQRVWRYHKTEQISKKIAPRSISIVARFLVATKSKVSEKIVARFLAATKSKVSEEIVLR